MSKTWEIGPFTKDNMIVVNTVSENNDGSATVALELGSNAMRLLLELGFKTLVKEAIKTGGANGKTEA